jgi:hypothetical protein
MFGCTAALPTRRAFSRIGPNPTHRTIERCGLAVYSTLRSWLPEQSLAPPLAPTGLEPQGMVSVLPFAVLVAAPPVFVAAVIGVLAATLVPRLRSRVTQDHPERPSGRDAHTRPGRILVVAAGGLGSLSIVIAAGQVLAL